MLDAMIGIFIFVGIIAVTTLLFSGWAVYGVIRAIASGIGALISSSSSPASSGATLAGQGTGQARCPRARCHANNPPGATFCRRCGCNLSGNTVGVPMARPPQRRQAFATPAPARAGNGSHGNYA
jgi:hypothetical protein